MAGCPGPDSNRDALRHCPVKTACLPVSPPGRGSCLRTGRGDGNLPGRKGGVKRDVQRESSAWRLARATAAGGTALFVQVPEFTVSKPFRPTSEPETGHAPTVEYIILPSRPELEVTPERPAG